MLLLLILLSAIGTAEADPVAKDHVAKNATLVVLPSSPWLKTVMKHRERGCWKRPWICHDGKIFPLTMKRLCCKNRCVDVSSDVNNCGLCRIRCPFTWQCCKGLCINTNVNPFHCGKCENKCPFGSFCFYGMCGYAQPLPPFPFPFPPKPPKPFPPKPPKPPKPFPPSLA